MISVSESGYEILKAQEIIEMEGNYENNHTGYRTRGRGRNDNKVFLYLERDVFEVRYKLYEIEAEYENTDFFRASKSVIINNMVILGGGHIFKWIDIKNVLMLAVMMLEILFVFIVVSVVIWRMHQKESERLNRKLQEYKSAGE